MRHRMPKGRGEGMRHRMPKGRGEGMRHRMWKTIHTLAMTHPSNWQPYSLEFYNKLFCVLLQILTQLNSKQRTDQLKKEVENHQKIDHENIVKFLGYFKENDVEWALFTFIMLIKFLFIAILWWNCVLKVPFAITWGTTRCVSLQNKASFFFFVVDDRDWLPWFSGYNYVSVGEGPSTSSW